jgi:ATP-dependent Lon protease
MGGDTLTIETNIFLGKGRIQITGQLGKVMQESVKAALSYARSRANEFGLPLNYFSTHDFHIHLPEGGIPKDGPSAGITIASSIISSILEIPINRNVAMTGEITLRGRVLPIGGLKEKCLAAQRLGISTVLYPKANEADMDEILQNTPLTLKLIPVSTMDEVLPYILENYKIENRMSRVSAGIEIAKETTPRGKMPPRTSPPQHTLL